MLITADSHTDHHLTPAHLAFVIERFGDRAAFFIETVELPAHLPSLPCELHGPAVGEPPIADGEVFFARRGDRPGDSRMIVREPGASRLLTVIGGEHKGECILFTAFGGPSACREPWDPSLDDAGRLESEAFWSEHALGAQPGAIVLLGDVHYLDGERLSCGTHLVRSDGVECRFERDRGEARIYLDGEQWVPIGDGDRFNRLSR